MSKTTIEWTDETWNPTVGCTRLSPGCENCYAFALHDKRHKAHQAGKNLPLQYARPFTELQLKPHRLDTPLHWREPRMVFVNSMSDLFHKDVPDSFVDSVFNVMFACKRHTFQILTKRAARMADYTTKRWGVFDGKPWPLASNIWLGVSVENQRYADERIPLLLQTPAAVRFLSCEPLLGPVELSNTSDAFLPFPGDDKHVDWVIAGGESGPGARPMHPAWVRSIRDQCRAVGIPFFFKQWGEWEPTTTVCDERCPSHALGRPHIFDGKGTTFHRSFQDGSIASQSTWASGRTDRQKDDGEIRFLRVGKKAAGRLLDGREWNEFPQTKGVEQAEALKAAAQKS